MQNKTLESIIAIVVSIAIAAGVAIAGSTGGRETGLGPVIVQCAVLAFVIQWIAFIPAFARQTEHFYDLVGSLTYLTVVLFALFHGAWEDPRTLLLALLVCLWAARLGTFLFRRVRRAGSDSRFDGIKPDFFRFLMAWTVQGLWVFLTLAAALAAMTSAPSVPLGWVGYLGLAVWLTGFGIEVVADRQKSRFKADPSNRGRFIHSGLWAWSRHPNYFGEIVLWIGIAIIAAPVLSGWQWVTMISPVFVYVLLTRVSGIPILEKSADERWGDDAEYRRYRDNTPVLVLRPPASAHAL